MSLRFNPPPNWPTPPQGFVPPAGWQPDPAWGPPPPGWELWVEDSAPSAPSANPMAGPQPTPPGMPQGGAQGSIPASGPVASPVVPSAPSAGSANAFPASYAGGDYAQSPTPYHSQGSPVGQPMGAPPGGGWQPIDISQPGGGSGDSIFRKWWFWLIAVLLVVAVVVGILFATGVFSGDDDKKSAATSTSTSSSRKSPSDPDPTEGPDPTEDPDPTSDPTARATQSTNQGGKDHGFSIEDPADPQTETVVMHAGEFDSDPDAQVEIAFDPVVWNADDQIKTTLAAQGFTYDPPPSGNQYMRVPVTVHYEGEGQLSSYEITVDYVTENGNSYSSEFVLADDDFRNMDQPRNGGTVTGYITFIIPAEVQGTGVFAVSAFVENYDTEMYVRAV